MKFATDFVLQIDEVTGADNKGRLEHQTIGFITSENVEDVSLNPVKRTPKSITKSVCNKSKRCYVSLKELKIYKPQSRKQIGFVGLNPGTITIYNLDCTPVACIYMDREISGTLLWQYARLAAGAYADCFANSNLFAQVRDRKRNVGEKAA